jgi:hypothetical protein
MYKIKDLLIISGIALSLFCCDEFKDDAMTLKKQSSPENAFRIDGYYYLQENNACIAPRFFYKDGCFLTIAGSFANVQEAEEHIRKTYLQNHTYKNTKFAWGVFKINANNIIVQYYQGDNYRTIVKVEEGYFSNDTTFQMTLRYRVNGEAKESIDNVYHFRQFSPKPDSNNQWIK